MTLPKERWAPLPSNPLYTVSSHGRVRGPRGYILKPFTCRTGHQQIVVSKDRVKYSVWIHRLVLLVFVGEPPVGMECLHRDGNSENNHLANLRWGTRLDNIKDKIRHSGKTSVAKLSYSDATAMRKAYDGKHGSIAALGRKYGVSISIACRVINNQTYKVAL